MKSLLTVTALIEVITGLALLIAPSAVVSLLSGAPLQNPVEDYWGGLVVVLH